MKVLLLAKYLKPRSTASHRPTKPEGTLGVGLMLLWSVYGNGLKRLVIHNSGFNTNLTGRKVPERKIPKLELAEALGCSRYHLKLEYLENVPDNRKVNC